MSSMLPWKVITADRAQGNLARIPERDRTRLLRAIDEMALNPFAGDFLKLKGEPREIVESEAVREVFLGDRFRLR